MIAWYYLKGLLRFFLAVLFIITSVLPVISFAHETSEAEDAEEQTSQVFEGAFDIKGEPSTINISVDGDSKTDDTNASVEVLTEADLSCPVLDSLDPDQEILQVLNISVVDESGEDAAKEQDVQVSISSDIIDEYQDTSVLKVVETDQESNADTDSVATDNKEPDNRPTAEENSKEDISNKDPDNVFENEEKREDKKVSTNDDSNQVTEDQKCEVIQTEDQDRPTELSFELTESATYILVGKKIEKTILASDGDNYRIEAEGILPEDAELEVTEVIEDEEYIKLTEELLNSSAEEIQYARFF